MTGNGRDELKPEVGSELRSNTESKRDPGPEPDPFGVNLFAFPPAREPRLLNSGARVHGRRRVRGVYPAICGVANEPQAESFASARDSVRIGQSAGQIVNAVASSVDGGGDGHRQARPQRQVRYEGEERGRARIPAQHRVRMLDRLFILHAPLGTAAVLAELVVGAGRRS